MHTVMWFHDKLLLSKFQPTRNVYNFPNFQLSTNFTP